MTSIIFALVCIALGLVNVWWWPHPFNTFASGWCWALAMALGLELLTL